MNEWKEKHQTFELDYHKTQGKEFNHTRHIEYWKNITNWIGIKDYGRTLDIGCGSRPPFKEYARDLTVIEPLADEYKKIGELEWWQGIDVHAKPAEEYLNIGQFDTVICWNCLDHTYDWKKILENIDKYAKGKIIIAVDFKNPHIGHPGINKEVFKEWVDTKKIIKAEQFSERDLALILE